MAQITGGRVVYKRTVQPAPYESITAEVEFAFVLEDREDAGWAAAGVFEIARAEVLEAIRLKRNIKEK